MHWLKRFFIIQQQYRSLCENVFGVQTFDDLLHGASAPILFVQQPIFQKFITIRPNHVSSLDAVKTAHDWCNISGNILQFSSS